MIKPNSNGPSTTCLAGTAFDLVAVSDDAQQRDDYRTGLNAVGPSNYRSGLTLIQGYL